MLIFPATSALYPENVIQHVTGTTTSEERKIEAALKDSLGLDVWINCTDSYQSQSWASQQEGHIAWGGNGYMTLPEAVCKDVVSFAKDPEGFKAAGQVNIGDLGINLEDYDMTPEDMQKQLDTDENRLSDAGYAFRVVAHEAGHNKGVEDESDAECFAFQAVDGLMQSMGVEAPLAHKVASYSAKNYEDVRGKEYAITPECNPNDLNYHLPDAHWPQLS